MSIRHEVRPAMTERERLRDAWESAAAAALLTEGMRIGIESILFLVKCPPPGKTPVEAVEEALENLRAQAADRKWVRNQAAADYAAGLALEAPPTSGRVTEGSTNAA